MCSRQQASRKTPAMARLSRERQGAPASPRLVQQNRMLAPLMGSTDANGSINDANGLRCGQSVCDRQHCLLPTRVVRLAPASGISGQRNLGNLPWPSAGARAWHTRAGLRYWTPNRRRFSLFHPFPPNVPVPVSSARNGDKHRSVAVDTSGTLCCNRH